ncbi:MAG: hypothetical protein JJE47_00385 [Acidimicrobiia bacterium]|nr:hypothetical protein [Acidimicrobiia bacterium]
MRLLIGLVAMSLAVGGCSTGGSGSTITTSPPSTRASTPSTSGAGTTTSNPSSTTLTTPTTTSVTPTTLVDDSVEILVTVAGGQLTSERRAEVKLGDNVKIVIRSDTADELHLHGYDLTVDVAAGQDAELALVAEIPGIFEVELEGLRLQVLELVVNQ